MEGSRGEVQDSGDHHKIMTMVRRLKCVGFPRGWQRSTVLSDFDSEQIIVWDIGAGPPMVRRLNVSGSEGLVAAGRPERFRL